MSYIIEKKYKCHKSNYGAARSKSFIKYIVVHYTAGRIENGKAALSNAKYFQTPGRNASAHYFVDSGNIIYESVPPLKTAWSVGAKHYYNNVRNNTSINIEICSYMKNGAYYFNEKAVKNAIELICDLMKTYNINIKNVVRHYDVTHKLCPAPFINILVWNDFKNRIISNFQKKEETRKFKFIELNILDKPCKITGFVENNENWVKVTSALTAIGYSSKWNSSKKRAIAVKNGKETLLDIRTYISASNISFCPLRDLFEYLGYTVSYDPDNKKINVY